MAMLAMSRYDLFALLLFFALDVYCVVDDGVDIVRDEDIVREDVIVHDVYRPAVEGDCPALAGDGAVEFGDRLELVGIDFLPGDGFELVGVHLPKLVEVDGVDENAFERGP